MKFTVTLKMEPEDEMEVDMETTIIQRGISCTLQEISMLTRQALEGIGFSLPEDYSIGGYNGC